MPLAMQTVFLRQREVDQYHCRILGLYEKQIILRTIYSLGSQILPLGELGLSTWQDA